MRRPVQRGSRNATTSACVGWDFAEEKGVENASTMRKQELMFAILKQLAIQETDIIGEGVVEVLSDGFGFLRGRCADKGIDKSTDFR
jgi:transcription termination factor Rho